MAGRGGCTFHEPVRALDQQSETDKHGDECKCHGVTCFPSPRRIGRTWFVRHCLVGVPMRCAGIRLTGAPIGDRLCGHLRSSAKRSMRVSRLSQIARNLQARDTCHRIPLVRHPVPRNLIVTACPAFNQKNEVLRDEYPCAAGLPGLTNWTGRSIEKNCHWL